MAPARAVPAAAAAGGTPIAWPGFAPQLALAGCAGLSPAIDRDLLQRVEDAGLNASAPPQQLWLDGWMLRFSPGKARRARCINALARGRSATAAKIERARAVYAGAGLPMVMRITPFTRPHELDAELAARGWTAADDTRVMVAATLPETPAEAAPAPGLAWQPLGSAALAQAVGALRGSPLAQRQAHAERLAASPLAWHALAIRRPSDGALVACGQCAIEGGLAGLYDVFVQPELRGHGLARRLCARLLGVAREHGAHSAYLQVEADNSAARAVYSRLGFVDGYGYHYRACPDG